MSNKKGRNSIIYKLGKPLLDLPLEHFHGLEKNMLDQSLDSDRNIVFVIALPRSGSTLTYQILCHCFKSTYISNIANLFYKLPYTSINFSSIFSRNYSSKFLSIKGYIDGSFSPSESMRVWNYWFGNSLDEQETYDNQQKEIYKSRKKYLKTVISNISAKSTFISCYIGHLLNLDELIKQFPNAIYLCVSRNTEDIALSVLRELRISNDDYFGLKMNLGGDKGKDKILDVIKQIQAQKKKMKKLKQVKNLFEIDYDDLILDPNKFVNEFNNNFAKKTNLALKKEFGLPQNFIKNRDNESELRTQIRKKINRIQDYD